MSATDARQGVVANCKGVIVSHHGVADLGAPRSKRISVRDVLIVEAIDLNVWIFTLAPHWAPTIMVCDKDLE
jgi:hypothetical protein